MKILLVIIGTISLILGSIGIVLPLLPTTPFLLLSAACYLRSSEKLHSWLINHKIFGQYILNYEHGAMSLKAKIFVLGFLYLSIGHVIFFTESVLPMKIGLFAVIIGVTIHLLKLKTV